MSQNVYCENKETNWFVAVYHYPPPLTQFLNNRIYMLLRWLHGCFQAGVMYVYVGQPYNYLLQTVGSGENWRLEATRLQV